MPKPPKIGMYPGSFDPFTYGHLEIAVRALELVDQLHISVGINPDKKGGMFTVKDRISIIEMMVNDNISWPHREKIVVDSYEDMLIDHAARIGAKWVFRGMRPVSDFDAEFYLQGVNHSIDSDIDTVIFFAHPKYQFTSSSLVKILVKGNKDTKHHIPKFVHAAIQEELLKK